jgi:triacylglycerol esterase/lipase EstA (alpha/beta hydrolase family)
MKNWIQDLIKRPQNLLKDNGGDYVVLVHAFAWTARSMNKIAQKLNSEGYAVININYPSRKYSIEYLAENFIAKTVNKLCVDKKRKIHFVTHSLGGIIIRKYIRTHPKLLFGKVVMIAPPNHGSEIVDFVKSNFLLKAYFGPVLQQLGTKKDSFINTDLKQAIKFELGVIAGDVCINPLARFIIKGDNDGLVPVECTKIRGMKDHIIIHSTHLFIVSNKECIKQISYFLKYGYFCRE